MKIVISLLAFVYLGFNVQLKESPFSDNPILEDGWYRAISFCNNGSALNTSDTKRYIWARVENNIVVYFGFSKSRSWQYEDVLADQNINKAPNLEVSGKRIVAKYNLADNVSASCEIEILLSNKK